ncbi:MAG: hypothetical protein WC468_02750 [Candidatus Paceibacterota bacterium]
MEKINIFDKLNKISLPVIILLGVFILGIFYYVVEVNKQQSIERQQEIKLQNDARIEEAKVEQTKKEYIAKRKSECYAIYEKERKQYNNVENFGYVETCFGSNFLCQDDSCEIIYKDKSTGEYFRKYY